MTTKLLALVPALLALFVLHQDVAPPESMADALRRHNPRPPELTVEQHEALLALLEEHLTREHPKQEHGGPEPNWNDPSIDDPCGGGPGGEEHENKIVGTAMKLGAIVRIDPPYYLDPAEVPGTPYGFPNAKLNVGDQGYDPTCGFPGGDGYTESGTLGRDMSWNNWVVNGHLDNHPNAKGYVFWAADWEPAYWIPWGWTLIDGDTVYDIWELGEGASGPYFDFKVHNGLGEWIGTTRYYDNPTDPGLVGTEVYVQGAWSFDGSFDLNDLTGSLHLADQWSIHFVPAL